MTNRDHAEYLETLGFEARPQLMKGESLAPAPAISSAGPSTNEAPQTPTNATEASTPGKAWLFILDHASQSQPQALELFDKMLDALKLNRSEIETTFAKDAGEVLERVEMHSNYRVCVVMGSSFGSNTNTPRGFATHSPAECLQSADLKRPVWETLQAAAKSLHSSL